MSKPEGQVFGTPNKGGRPRKLTADEATLKQLRGLGNIQATVREAAAFFSVSPMTFEAFLKEEGVREAFEEGQANGRISLRRLQFRLAEKNAAMAIWLGKQHLDQRDRQEHSGLNGGPVRVNLTNLTNEQLAQLEALMGAAGAIPVQESE